jgi:hypothetical protein
VTFLVRSEHGYVADHDDHDDERISLVFSDEAADAIVIESETTAIIVAAFVGGEVVEMAEA